MKLNSKEACSSKSITNFVQVNYFDKFKSPEFIAKIKQKYPTVRSCKPMKQYGIHVSDNSKIKGLSKDMYSANKGQ